MINTIDPQSSVPKTNSSTSGSKVASTNDALGKDDFLKILVAQMKNQDPMNPTDSTQSIAQLAQFSSLEQMTNIATAMNTLSQSMTNFSQQSSLTQGAAMIGKWVSGVDTDGVTPMEGTVESVKWLDGHPKLQIRKSDGTLADLEMSLITQVGDTKAPTTVATAVTP
ncbi:MAG TPA: flagellar hook capping FlgD N-terminal domain-containing protein [Desulfosporosinus sp.]